MKKLLARLLRASPARFAYHYLKSFVPGRSQSDESRILVDLAERVKAPPYFIEFGFHPNEFNCIGLKNRFAGLLIDGDASTVSLARRILPRGIEVENRFLTTDNLDFIRARVKDRALGILSVDVDGNDYWFLEALIDLRPAIIAVEYNGSFGLRPVTVPYDPAFDRHAHHASGWYHGASLTALAALCARHGYDLAAVAAAGGNAFFVRRDLRPADMPVLDPMAAYLPSRLRDQWSGKTAAEQWDAVKDMPYVSIEG